MNNTGMTPYELWQHERLELLQRPAFTETYNVKALLLLGEVPFLADVMKLEDVPMDGANRDDDIVWVRGKAVRVQEIPSGLYLDGINSPVWCSNPSYLSDYVDRVEGYYNHDTETFEAGEPRAHEVLEDMSVVVEGRMWCTDQK